MTETSTGSSVVLYIRVSTEEQDLAGQERELREEAARCGWPVVEVYSEKITGTGKSERAEYQRLVGDAHLPDRPWTHLLVWSLDRFSRERYIDAMGDLLDLEAAGVRFHSLKEPYLATPPPGDINAEFGRNLLVSNLSLVAAFESRRRSERVLVAMREIKAGRRRTRSGRPPGRPRRVTPELVSKMEVLRRRGEPWARVAQMVGLPAGTCRAAVWKSRKAAGAVP